MKSIDIARQRIKNQEIGSGEHSTPTEVVERLGAVQAQDFLAAKWALGLRMADATDDQIEAAFNAGEILRTHVMRPTWHFVTPADIGWMLTLTAPRVAAINNSYNRKVGLDEAAVERSNRIIADALGGGNYLTRSELREYLAPALDQIDEHANRLQATNHLLMSAELASLICSGPRRGKQFTYALLEERAPDARKLSREESLKLLTLRYFTSHGPATRDDYRWWSGMTAADVDLALEMIGAELAQETVDGTTCWMPAEADPAADEPATANLLPAFDEYLVSYKDRAAVLNSEHANRVNAGGGMLAATIALDGRIVGSWKRTIKARGVEIELAPFAPWSAADRDAIHQAAERYGAFHGLPVTLS